MGQLPRYGVPDGAAERRAYAGVMAQAFAGDSAIFETWVERSSDDVRVLRDNGVCAGLTIYDFGQFFGGASVPCWGVAGVVVSPELRSKGFARELMTANLRENFDHGPPISALYPAAPKLYRNLGWEFAGSRCTYAYAISELPTGSHDVMLRPATEADLDLMVDLYHRRYSHENGCLDRNENIWTRIRQTPKETPICGYIAEQNGKATGYALYFQKRNGSNFRFDLHARDLVCLNADVMHAFISFFASHRSVADNLYFYGAPEDPLLAAVQMNQYVRLHERLGWMLRIVRVKEALETRGYSPHVNATAEVKVIDTALPENAGVWKLELADGQMRAGQGGAAETELDIRGLAVLYPGTQGPKQLRAAGLLNGSEKHDAALAAMFAGTAAWMPDFF